MHEKCFRIVYNDNVSLYEELLEIGNSVSVHHRNIQFLQLSRTKYWMDFHLI